MTDRETINQAFATLRERGIEARGPWTCCGSCGHAEMEEHDSYIFFHAQSDDAAFNNDEVLAGYFDDEDFDEGGNYIGSDTKLETAPQGERLDGPLYLAHDGSEQTFDALTDAVRGTGLFVTWSHDPDETFILDSLERFHAARERELEKIEAAETWAGIQLYEMTSKAGVNCAFEAFDILRNEDELSTADYAAFVLKEHLGWQ